MLACLDGQKGEQVFLRALEAIVQFDRMQPATIGLFPMDPPVFGCGIWSIPKKPESYVVDGFVFFLHCSILVRFAVDKRRCLWTAENMQIQLPDCK